jgi:hypothetical protein
MFRHISVRVVLACFIVGMVFGSLQAQERSLVTRWAAEVSADNVLPEYPRPQLVRADWLNLNGLWSYTITARAADKPTVLDGEILVPFPLESTLSGVRGRLGVGDRLWHQRRAGPLAYERLSGIVPTAPYTPDNR